NAYAQPAQDMGYQQPAQNTYTQHAQDMGYQQPMQNTYTQPVQNMNYQQQGAYMQQPMGGVILEPAASVAELGSQDGMEAINPAEMPESTGYSTAESLAELTPQRLNNNPAPNYDFPPAPMPGDFRAEPEYGSSTAAYDPMATPPYAYVPEKSNPLMGIVGALLFSLAACVLWVLIGMSGYVSYLGGLAMGFCCVTGYKLLGKRFDVFGFVCCIIVILLAVLGCNIFIEVLTLYNEPGVEEVLRMLGYNSFFETFFRFFDLANFLDNALASVAPGADSVMGNFMKNLLIGYAFAGVGFLVVAIPQLKSKRI
ncbi:MAG: hypothetical protein J1E39_01435, partial [Eubacterium sp.]|nr:hypothetical protein [Eubacterium sp.]